MEVVCIALYILGVASHFGRYGMAQWYDMFPLGVWGV